ncbi:hypothetical protein GVAV_000506 [Gurleya vavrai]
MNFILILCVVKKIICAFQTNLTTFYMFSSPTNFNTFGYSISNYLKIKKPEPIYQEINTFIGGRLESNTILKRKLKNMQEWNLNYKISKLVIKAFLANVKN